MDLTAEEQPQQDAQIIDQQPLQDESQVMPDDSISDSQAATPKNISASRKIPKVNKKIIVSVTAVLLLTALSLGLFYLFGKNSEDMEGDESTQVASEEETLLTTGSLSGEIPRFAQFSEETINITPSVPSY